MIPLNIFQTWERKTCPPGMKESLQSVKDDNPEFNHFFHDKDDRRDYITNNFSSDVVDTYDLLVPGAYQADLYRYCAMFKEGGIYMDVKFKCFNHYKLIQLTDREYLCTDPAGTMLINGFLVCSRGNTLMRKMIESIVVHVKNRDYCGSDIAVTGPGLLASFFTKDEIKSFSFLNCEFRISGPRFFDGEHYVQLYGSQILTSYTGFYEETSPHPLPRYGQLWDMKNIYKNHEKPLDRP